MRTETTPDKTPLPEDSVAAADEELTSAQVPFRLLYHSGYNKPEWVKLCFIYPGTRIASFQSCGLWFLLVLRTQQHLGLSKTLVV